MVRTIGGIACVCVVGANGESISIPALPPVIGNDGFILFDSVQTTMASHAQRRDMREALRAYNSGR